MKRYRYEIDDIPPSNNRFIGRNNRWEYQQIKQYWRKMIAYCCIPKPEKPIERARVHIRYYFKDKIRRDPDNYSGKMLLDGLTAAKILKDDSFDCIQLELSATLDRKHPRTEIFVEEDGEGNERRSINSNREKVSTPSN